MGPSSVDEMVLAFLRAEIDAPRYRDRLADVDRKLIDEANRADAAQNRARREALAYRHGFYDRVPADTSWQRWALKPAELGDVRYAKHPTWDVVSSGKRLVRTGAANAATCVVLDETGFDVCAGIRETSRAIDRGRPMAELIAVATVPDASSLVLMEGHSRATAYLLAKRPPAEVMVLVGWSRSMDTTWQPWF